MTEAEVRRVATAISKAMSHGCNKPWKLAMIALSASNAYRETHQIANDRLAKSIAKNLRYRASNKKGWETRKKNIAARSQPEAAEMGEERDAA